jgi:O-antigen ligase
VSKTLAPAGGARSFRARPWFLARWDGVSVLTLYVVLLLGVPSVMVVAPLGSAGSPSTVIAVGLFLLWSWFQLHRSSRRSGSGQNVRRATLVWLIVMVAAYGHAMAGPVSPDEVSPADFGLLKLVGFCGVLLVTTDGIRDLARLRVVTARLVVAISLVAVLGLVQFLTRELLIDRLHIPGLASIPHTGVTMRNGLPRPNGTSTHPIEYGVVLSIGLPLAVVHALWAPTHRWMYRCLLAVIAVDVFLSSSRSALVCTVLSLLVLAASWPAALRIRAIVVAAFASIAVYIAVPGSLGATIRLFTGAANDSSIDSRTGSYDLAGAFFSQSPWFGRGFGTFLPKYWIFDNAYLGLLVEGGLLGLGGLVVLVLVAGSAARSAARTLPGQLDRQLARGVLASIVSGAAGLAFFDSFGFPQSAGCLFLVLGLAGALRRLAPASSTAFRRGSGA